jgi:trehalose 6-phosphate phosphatase
LDAQAAPRGVCQNLRSGYRVKVTDIASPSWPAEPALFLDLDGTLLEFALDPAKVSIPDRLHSILARLPQATTGAIAFVSGRTLADLDRLLGQGRFPLAAVHGLERRDAEGRLSTALAEHAQFSRMHEFMDRIAAEYPQTVLEHKGVALALHYRRCPDLEPVLVECVERGLNGMASGLKLLRGKMVLEVRPVGADKGTAIAAFMQEPPFAGRTPVFIGDDLTDEDGFREVNRLGGISVKVDAGATCAAYRLADTRAVIDWLEQLVGRL